MTWEVAGAIGEVVGGVAVVATLIYLSIQLKNARSEFSFWAAQDARTSIRDLMYEPMRNEVLRDSIVKLRSLELTSITSVEDLYSKAGLSPHEEVVYNNYQQLWLLYNLQIVENLNLLTPAQRTRANRVITAVHLSGPGKIWFDDVLRSSTPDHPLVRYIEAEGFKGDDT